MPKFYKKIRNFSLPPGTLADVEGAPKAKIRLMNYTEKDFLERELATVEESFSFRESHRISWINIDGRDVDVMKKIDEHFGVHPLVLEDIINAGQRPKVEDYGEYLFFVLKMIYFDDITPTEKIKVYNKGVEVNFSQEDTFNPIYRSGDVHIPFYKEEEALLKECRHFIDCVASAKATISNGRFGLEVIKILEATDRSLASGGQEVTL